VTKIEIDEYVPAEVDITDQVLTAHPRTGRSELPADMLRWRYIIDSDHQIHLDPSHIIGELSDAVSVSGWRVTEESLNFIISQNRRFTAINFYECEDLTESMVGMLAMRVGTR
jgi:hypothetical protein